MSRVISDHGINTGGLRAGTLVTLQDAFPSWAHAGIALARGRQPPWRRHATCNMRHAACGMQAVAPLGHLPSAQGIQPASPPALPAI